MAGTKVGGSTKEKQRPHKKEFNRGAWTAEEDRKLAEAIGIHGAKQWTTIAAKAGQEEDLIIRLHKLLGNRWSLIAGRLPGRTDNEIKNYSSDAQGRETRFDANDFFDFSNENPSTQEWVTKFLDFGATS